MRSFRRVGGERSRPVIMALILVLLALGTVLGVLGYTGLSDLQKPQDDPAWSIFQMGFEHQRLLLATETGADAAALRLRGDIYMSRVSLLRDAPALASVRNSLAPEKLRSLLESADETDRLIDHAGTPEGRTALVEQLRRDAPPVRDLMIDMTNLNRAIQNADRTRHVRELIFSIAALEVLLAVLIGLCIFVLRISDKLASATEAALASADLLEKNMELELEKARSDEASKAKSQFLSNMSHEIRTPLNGIIGTLQLVDSDDLSRENRDCFEIVKRSSDSLLGIVNGILDIAKIEANEESISSRPFDIRNLVSDILSQHEVLADEKHLDLFVHFDPMIPRLVVSDPLKVEQILNNLLSNALKFTERGSVTLTIMRQTATGSSEQTDDLVLKVADTGIGIAADDQSGLFQPFRQVDGSLTRRYLGTGLGLSIVRKLAVMLGGEVSLESRPGAGSVFSVRLPATVEKSGEAAENMNGNGVEVALIGSHYSTVFRAGQILASLGTKLHCLDQPDAVVAHAAIPQERVRAAIVDRRFAEDAPTFLGTITGGAGGWQTPTIVIDGLPTTEGQEREFVVSEISGRFSRSSFLETLQQCNVLESAGKVRRQQRNSAPAGVAMEQFKRLKVLVVDDNSINRRVLDRLLRKLDVSEVATAGGAKEAVEKVARDTFDLVFMDIQMPDIDGYRATKMIRQQGSKVRIVACSAHAFEADIERSVEEGLDGHLSKPVVLGELNALLLRLFPPEAIMAAVSADEA
jgi:two-component system sensor histidine kinase/response regulator